MTRMWLWVSLLTLMITCASGALADAEKPYDETKLDYFQTDSINIDFLHNSWNIPTDYFKDGKTIGQMVIDGFDAVDAVIDAANPGSEVPSDVLNYLLGELVVDEKLINLLDEDDDVEIQGDTITIIEGNCIGFLCWDDVSIDTSVNLSFDTNVTLTKVTGADELLRVVLQNGGLRFHQQVEALPAATNDLIDPDNWQQAIGRPAIFNRRVFVENGTATLKRAGFRRWVDRDWALEIPWVTDPDNLERAIFRTHQVTGPTGDPDSRSYKVTSYDAATGKVTIDLNDPDDGYPLTFEAGGSAFWLEPLYSDYTGRIFGLGLSSHGSDESKRIIADLSAPKLGLPREPMPEPGQWILDYEVDAGNVNWAGELFDQPVPDMIFSFESKVTGSFLGTNINIDLLPLLGLNSLKEIIVPVPAAEFSGHYQFYMDPNRSSDQTRFSGLSEITWRAFGFPTVNDLCLGNQVCETAMQRNIYELVIDNLPPLFPCDWVLDQLDMCYTNSDLIEAVLGEDFSYPTVTLGNILQANNVLLDDALNDSLSKKAVPLMINAANDTLWAAIPDQTEKFWIMDGINALFDPIARRAAEVATPVPALGFAGILTTMALLAVVGFKKLGALQSRVLPVKRHRK